MSANQTVQKCMRIPRNIVKEIEEIVRDTQRDFTTTTNALLEEAVRAHRCPGIVFTEGVHGKRARIAGTGLEVWEVIATYKNAERDLKRLARAYHWLTQQQLKSAIGYYRLYAREIDALIAENENWTPVNIRKKYPVLSAGDR